jgi:O-methyltransferase involved in polyketide biosynthesis
MTVTIDHLAPVEKTLLITLTGRALDARTNRPLLGDRLAAEVLDRLGSGADVVKLSGTVRIATAVRSKMLDRIVGGFIAAHANAVVVELGCGLETRMHLLSPPATVDWYDVDLPGVIALRRRVIPNWSAHISSRRDSPTRTGSRAFHPTAPQSPSPTAFSVSSPKPTTGRS